jgi:anti-sigma B factor antagonist
MGDHRRLQVSTKDGTTIVRFVDRKILDEASIQEMGNELFSLVEQDRHEKLLLNFEDVDFLSSAALGKLISLKRRVTQAAGQLKMCCIRPEIYEVFKITNLDQVFDIKDDERDALADF